MNAIQQIETAHKEAVWVDRSDLGMLKFTGETRLDLINRMSTQAVNGLGSGEGTATILTTDIGRIIDRLILYTSSDAVYTLTGANNADAIARYLMRFVFFNDDFHIQDLSSETTTYGVYGAKARQVLEDAVGQELDFPLHHWRKFDDLYIHRTDPIAGDGYLLMSPDALNLQSLVSASGASHSLQSVPQPVFDYLRIESMQGLHGKEYTSDYIPLEANLWDDVSFNKGCYIGQEIIARMESRGQLAKKLVDFTSAKPLAEGATITADGKSVGSVTSSASIDGLPTRALGYVKTKALDSDAVLMVGDTVLTL